MTTLVFHVPDIHCGACRAEIEQSLGRVTGIASVVADPRTGTVTVSFDDLLVDQLRLVDVLTTAGFPPARAHPGSGPDQPTTGTQP